MPKPVLQQNPVARRQDAGRLIGMDRDPGEERLLLLLHPTGEIGERGLLGDIERRSDAAGPRDTDEGHRAGGVARLHAGLCIAAIVKDRDR